MKEIQLDFTYTKQDCVDALRLHYKSVMHLKLDTAIMIGAAILGAYQWHHYGPNNASYVSFGAAAGLAMLLLCAFYILPRLFYRRSSKLHHPYHLVFSDKGIDFKSKDVESTLQWDYYKKLVSGPQTYLLYYDRAGFTVIPKRLFETPETQAAFEAMLVEKIPYVSDPI